MFCGYCGGEIPRKSKFCPACGMMVQLNPKQNKPKLRKFGLVIGSLVALAILSTVVIGIMLENGFSLQVLGSGYDRQPLAINATPAPEKQELNQQQAEVTDASRQSQITVTPQPTEKPLENIWMVYNPIKNATCNKRSFYTTLYKNDIANQCWIVIAYEVIELKFSADEMKQLLDQGYVEFIKLDDSARFDEYPQSFQPNKYRIIKTDSASVYYLSCETDGGHEDDKPWLKVNGKFDIGDPTDKDGFSPSQGFADHQIKRVDNSYILRQLAFTDMRTTIYEGRNALFLGDAYEFRLPYGLPIFGHYANKEDSETGYEDCGHVVDIGDRRFRCLCGDSQSTVVTTAISSENGIVTFIQAFPYYDRVPLDIHRLVSLDQKFQE